MTYNDADCGNDQRRNCIVYEYSKELSGGRLDTTKTLLNVTNQLTVL